MLHRRSALGCGHRGPGWRAEPTGDEVRSSLSRGNLTELAAPAIVGKFHAEGVPKKSANSNKGWRAAGTGRVSDTHIF
jgi:hypothetical protein